MYIKQLEVGLMQNFNYLIGDPETRECAYVDPAWEVDRLLKMAVEDGYQIKKILLTHKHFDHIEGVEEVVKKTGAAVFIHPDDAEDLQGVAPLTFSKEFKVGHLNVTALHTPGHTPGSTCYLVKDPESAVEHLFTGDTLFQGNCGRSDLPGGDPKILYKSLMELKTLDPSTKVYPGHDYGSKPVTTIGYEKQHNPTLKVSSFKDFDLLP